MDTAAVAVVGILAIVLVVAFGVYRAGLKGRIRGPFGTELEVGGSNRQEAVPPAIEVNGVKSRKGKARLEDTTGRGVKGRDIDAHGDVDIHSGAPSAGEGGKKV